ncbi:thiamine-phosphate kinase [Fodinicurvata sediminis]|uniref:thiamine-phosphate kinase n=1 Tax=Fodinicurvata sediminis TaxID=1121832 RepID=UPI0003B78432|nr:thiamine-phosphate kinase [Fodinicurvata sediminis]
MVAEFELIARYFAPLAAAEPGAFGLQNDAAVLDIASGHSLVTTLDSMVSGVHYLPDDPPDQLARKLLRVNLSDLAAMGARPRGYLLSLAMTGQEDEDWLQAFAKGLEQDQQKYDVVLLGGDTLRTPGPQTLSLTALGEVPRGQALQRTTARNGDDIYLTGTLGQAALGLFVRLGQASEKLPGLSDAQLERLETAYRLPDPPVALGGKLPGLVTACLDVSDGLLADLGHIAEGSGLGADVEQSRLPLSQEAAQLLAQVPERLQDVVGGGDDYQLLFTSDPGQREALEALSVSSGIAMTRIGRMSEGEAVRLLDNQGRAIAVGHAGWTHF